MGNELSTWYVPSSLAEAITLAKALAEAGDLVPEHYRGNANKILAGIQYGAELGLSPMASLQCISVIKGKTTLWGDGLLGVCQSHPKWNGHEEYFEGEGNELKATCKVWRLGEDKPHVGTFSVADAKAAGLIGKDTYRAYLRRMLQMRARGFALRDAFADALRGVISREEAEDYPEKQAQATVVDSKPLTGTEALKDRLGINDKPGPATAGSSAPEPRSSKGSGSEAVTDLGSITPPNRPPPDESAANPMELPKEEPPVEKGKKPAKDSKLPPAPIDAILDYAHNNGITVEDVFLEAERLTKTKIPDRASLNGLGIEVHRKLYKSLQAMAGENIARPWD